jgi:hypothetical protein
VLEVDSAPHGVAAAVPGLAAALLRLLHAGLDELCVCVCVFVAKPKRTGQSANRLD